MHRFFLNFSDRTTLHGISRLSRSKTSGSRVCWSVILIGALFGFSFNISMLIAKYRQIPLLTNVQHEVDSFIYPDITICNLNPIYFPPSGTAAYSRISHVIRAFKREQRAFAASGGTRAPRDHRTIKGSQIVRNVADFLYINHRHHHRHRRINYSHPAWSFIVTCEFNNRDCSWRDFHVDLVWPYGNCFTFNIERRGDGPHSNLSDVSGGQQSQFQSTSKPNGLQQQQQQYGGGGGSGDNGKEPPLRKTYEMLKRPYFQVLLYKNNEFPAEFSFDMQNTLFMPSGAFLMLHNVRTRYQITESHLLDGATFIKLKLTRKIHSATSGRCSPRPTTVYYINEHSRRRVSYRGTWVDCVNYKLQHKIHRYCGCLLEIYPVPADLDDRPFCKSLLVNRTLHELSTCSKAAYDDVFSAATKRMLDACFIDPCDHFTYRKVISQARFPAVKEKNTQQNWLRQLKQLEELEVQHFGRSDLSSKVVLPQTASSGASSSSSNNTSTIQEVLDSGQFHRLNIEFIERNFMMLQISPASLFMDVSEETLEYSIERLLSDIGGSVGLWLGASVITMFELFDVIFEMVRTASKLSTHYSKWNGKRRRCAAEDDAPDTLHSPMYDYRSSEDLSQIFEETSWT